MAAQHIINTNTNIQVDAALGNALTATFVPESNGLDANVPVVTSG